MNTEEIRKILESFYNGETTSSEELLLKKYFESSDVNDDLLKEKDLFLQLYDFDPVVVPTSLKANIESLIDGLAAENSNTLKSPPKRLTVKLILRRMSIAASIALIVFAGIYISKVSLEGDNQSLLQASENGQTQMTGDEYIEVKNAIRMFSSNFTKGMEQIDEISNNLEKSNDILQKTFSENN